MVNALSERTVSKSQVFASLPAEWAGDLLPNIQALLQETRQKVFVLDDDPTGTQTVYDTVVLTEWSVDTLCQEMGNPSPCCYILTNSRSVSETAAEALNTQIAQNLQAASKKTGRAFTVVSRSDSTLRGHFPAETDALAKSLDTQPDGVLIVPAFMAGGRYTINGVHYVEEGEQLIPAAQTPYARDSVFGYNHSDLRDWVEEKTGGLVQASEVTVIAIDLIRKGGPDAVREVLSQSHKGAVYVVDAVTERDLAVTALACLQAEAAGKRLIYRTAASFAAARVGIALRPTLQTADMSLLSGNGGLVVVGSYIKKSSDQLGFLLASDAVTGIEVDVQALLDADKRAAEITRVVDTVNGILASGGHAAIYTSRELVLGHDSDSNLSIGQQVSFSLVEIVRSLNVVPRFIIAKGGITSSDLATKALNIKRAEVLGQILPGIPVWRPDHNSDYAGGTYIVFPGNVGGNDALLRAVEILSN